MIILCLIVAMSLETLPQLKLHCCKHMYILPPPPPRLWKAVIFFHVQCHVLGSVGFEVFKFEDAKRGFTL